AEAAGGAGDRGAPGGAADQDDREDDEQRGACRARPHDAAAPAAALAFQNRSGRRTIRSVKSRSARVMSPALKQASSRVSWKTSRWARLPPSSMIRGVS